MVKRLLSLLDNIGGTMFFKEMYEKSVEDFNCEVTKLNERIKTGRYVKSKEEE